MSKKLDKAIGVHINNQYHSKQVDTFSKLMLSTFKGNEPIKHKYYELVDKKGNVVHLITSNDETIVQSAANRLGLDYREVEFNETWEDLDKESDEVCNEGN